MPRNAQEFVSFVATHFRPVEAMCREHVRFASDDDIVSFLRRFSDDKSVAKLIGRMREVGVLVDLAGEWAPPPFLAEFIEKVAQRHALASPKVIHSWVEALQQHVTELMHQIEPAYVDFGVFDVDIGRSLLHEIADVFQAIVRTVQGNCARITSEVAEYRTVEGAARLRSRLNWLLHLHDEYLEPLIRIVDIGGDFYAVTEQITNCCARVAVLAEIDAPKSPTRHGSCKRKSSGFAALLCAKRRRLEGNSRLFARPQFANPRSPKGPIGPLKPCDLANGNPLVWERTCR